MFRRTNEAQRGASACTLNHLDLSAGDDFTTKQAVPFLIQEMPLPKVIEPS